MTRKQKEYNSIDELMIPTKAKFCPVRQYIKGKPNPWGIKFWARCGATGYLHDFEPYQGASKKSMSNLGVGGDAVMKLVQHLPENRNFKILADNFFTSVPLAMALLEKGYQYTGTIRSNRISSVKFKTDKELKKSDKKYDLRFDAKNNILLLKWLDKRAVYMLSTYVPVEPMSSIISYDKKKKSFVNSKKPKAVIHYNEYMGGVDLHDSLVARYRPSYKSKKWYLYVFWQTIVSATVNSYINYKDNQVLDGTPSRDVITRRKYLFKLSSSLMHSISERKRGRPCLEENLPTNEPKRAVVCALPAEEIRFDGLEHWPDYIQRGRCRFCSMKTEISCSKCKIRLCLVKNSVSKNFMINK